MMQAPAPTLGGSLQEFVGRLSSMPTQQVAQMAKDPAVGYLAATELRARNQRRAQMQPPVQPPQGTVVDKEAMQALQAESAGIMSGIPQMPTQRMAQGGVVRFSGGDYVSPEYVATDLEMQAARRLAQLKKVPYDDALREVIGQRTNPFREIGNAFRAGIEGVDKALGTSLTTLPNRAARAGTNALVALGGGTPLNSVDEGAMGSWDVLPQARWTGVNSGHSSSIPQQTTPPPGAGGRASASSSLSMTLPAGLAGLTVKPKEYWSPGDDATMRAERDVAAKQIEANLYKAPTEDASHAALVRELARVNQLNPEDPAAIAARGRLERQLQALEGKEPKNLRQGWIEAGLGMLASQSPHFGVGIGEGGLKGTRVYRELQADDAQRTDRLTAAQLAAAQSEMQRKAGLFGVASGNVNTREGQREKELAGNRAFGEFKYGHAGKPLEDATKRSTMDSQAATAAYYTTKANLEPYDTVANLKKADAAMIAANRPLGGGGGASDSRDLATFQRAIAAETTSVRDMVKNDTATKMALMKELSKAKSLEEQKAITDRFISTLAMRNAYSKYGSVPQFKEFWNELGIGAVPTPGGFTAAPTVPGAVPVWK